MPDFSDISLYLFIPLISFVGWGVRHHLIRKGAWNPLKKTTLCIGLVAWFITESARSFYRPFIYANKLDDWHIADTIGNTMGTITAIFMIVTLAGRGDASDYRLIAVVVAGLVVYELLSSSVGWAVDVWDLCATACFGLVSALIYHHLLRHTTIQVVP